ncbi:MAG: hypothetical protein ACYCX3_02895 [Thermoleophilia bacterium]
MRVVLSPDAALLPGVRATAGMLVGAGPGSVVDLAQAGVKNLRRRLSAAEVHSLRKALLGLGPGHDLRPREPEDTMVGYLCVARAVAPGGPAAEATPVRSPNVGSGDSAPVFSMIAVTDHANLRWESPLTGPNDDSLGPRFPVTAGLYAPEEVTAVLAAEPGVVAGVWNERGLSPFEAGVVAAGGFAAVAAELAPVTVVAAHLGYRVAAAVLVPAESEDDTGSPAGRRP